MSIVRVAIRMGGRMTSMGAVMVGLMVLMIAGVRIRIMMALLIPENRNVSLLRANITLTYVGARPWDGR
jgi:hypothetical protein